MSKDEPYQRYLLLSNQQQNLRRRLSLQIPSASPMTTPSSGYLSLACSPTSYTHRSNYAMPYITSPTPPQVPSAHPVPTMPGYGHHRGVTPPISNPGSQSADDSKALYEINQQIKATLTELLNNDSVKHDEKFRAWVQSRLMDAEMELKRQRRRRSSACVDNREIAESIAGHFDHQHHGSFRWAPSF